MLSPLQNAGLFLINTLFDIYLMILMIRLILYWARADYYNPLTQFIIKATQPVIAPLRRFIPNFAYIETSTLIVIILVDALKFFLIGLVMIGMPKELLGIAILASADALKLLLNTFFYAIFFQAILSWIQPTNSPITELLNQITTPILRPIHRLMPRTGGFDLSPIPALILLQLLLIILAHPLIEIGMGLAFG